MSYRWVMKYLPDRFKDSTQSGRASLAARRATGIFDELLRPPKMEGALKIKNYVNTDFVSLILERGFYEKFESGSPELGGINGTQRPKGPRMVSLEDEDGHRPQK